MHQLSPEYCRGSWAFSLTILTPPQCASYSTAQAIFPQRSPNLSLPFLKPFLLPIAFQAVSKLLGKAGRDCRALSPTLGPPLAPPSYEGRPHLCSHPGAPYAPYSKLPPLAHALTLSQTPGHSFFPSPSFPGQVLLTLQDSA